jgi:hypothetical protein
MAGVLEPVAMAGCALILVVREVFWLKRWKDWGKHFHDFFNSPGDSDSTGE